MQQYSFLNKHCDIDLFFLPCSPSYFVVEEFAQKTHKVVAVCFEQVFFFFSGSIITIALKARAVYLEVLNQRLFVHLHSFLNEFGLLGSSRYVHKLLS